MSVRSGLVPVMGDEELTPRERAMMETYEKKLTEMEKAASRCQYQNARCPFFKSSGDGKGERGVSPAPETAPKGGSPAPETPEGNNRQLDGHCICLGCDVYELCGHSPAGPGPNGIRPKALPRMLRDIRFFYLYRTMDVSGVSGTGAVAFGVVFPDGKAAMWWKGGESISVWNRVEDIAKIHGHDGRTVLSFIDPRSLHL